MEITSKETERVFAKCTVSGCFSPEKVFLATLFMCVPVFSSPMIIIHTAQKSFGLAFLLLLLAAAAAVGLCHEI